MERSWELLDLLVCSWAAPGASWGAPGAHFGLSPFGAFGVFCVGLHGKFAIASKTDVLFNACARFFLFPRGSQNRIAAKMHPACLWRPATSFLIYLVIFCSFWIFSALEAPSRPGDLGTGFSVQNCTRKWSQHLLSSPRFFFFSK